jgi:hypothetical protein
VADALAARFELAPVAQLQRGGSAARTTS